MRSPLYSHPIPVTLPQALGKVRSTYAFSPARLNPSSPSILIPIMSPSSQQTTLPGIQDLFPDHLYYDQVNGHDFRRPSAPASPPSRAVSRDHRTLLGEGTNGRGMQGRDLSFPPLAQETQLGSRKASDAGRRDRASSYSYAPQHGAGNRPRHAHVPPFHESPPETPSYSFDVLRPDPSRTSLEPVAARRHTIPRAPSAAAFRVDLSASVQRTRTATPNSHESSPDRSDASDDDNSHTAPSKYSAYAAAQMSSPMTIPDGESSPPDAPFENGRRHMCPHCSKRFNRPSSLGIHVNTHTGAKPFKCPYPGCGRTFNVNSNMRRHYRNHPQSPAAEDGSGWSSASPLPGQGLQIIGYATPATAAAANGTSSDEDDSPPMEIDVQGRRGKTLSWEPYTPDWYEQKYKEEGYMSGRRGS